MLHYTRQHWTVSSDQICKLTTVEYELRSSASAFVFQVSLAFSVRSGGAGSSCYKQTQQRLQTSCALHQTSNANMTNSSASLITDSLQRQHSD
eukprot:10732-Heterococcus_DN1.PRE.1